MNKHAALNPENPGSAPPLRLVQVSTDHYQSHKYDELHRWISYWYQIQAVARSGARSVLEIGVGSGVLSSYLRSRLGMQVTTFDFDESLGSDLVGDVRQLDAAVHEEMFEAVVAFQVLEHLPFSDLGPAIQQLARASRNSVIISLPHFGWNVQARLRFWKWNWVFGRRVSKNPDWIFDGEHFWEIGTKGHSLGQVRSTIATVLDIEREYFCADYPYHYFFEGRKRKCSPKCESSSL